MALRRLCSLLDLPARGGRLFKNAAGSRADILVFRIAGGRLRAWNAHCPHAGALMRPENEMGGKLVCFLHQWDGLAFVCQSVLVWPLSISHDVMNLVMIGPAFVHLSVFQNQIQTGWRGFFSSACLYQEALHTTTMMTVKALLRT